VPEASAKAEDGGLYLYGIIQDAEDPRWGLFGIASAPGVHTICHRGLSAVVGPVLSEARESAQEKLLAHNHVLEEVMKTHSVLPLRVGTVASGETEVRAFLHKANSPLRDALKQIEGAVEFDVEVGWNGGEIFRLIEEQDEEIRKFKREAMAAGKPLQPEEHMAAGMMVADAIARQRGQFARVVEEGLQPWSERVSSLKDRTGQAVFNAAFLVRRERIKPFEEAIYRLGDQHGRVLKFRYAGPLPCYSFVHLHVTTVEFQAVDEARKSLGLGRQISLTQIKQAYRELASQCHPDRNSADAQAGERFEKLAASYHLLVGFWETLGCDPSSLIPVTEEAIGNRLVVVSKERRAVLAGS